jgi:eukaryotic-like serine/threonine-protein kinase
MTDAGHPDSAPEACPVEADLRRMLDDELSPATAAPIEAHVASCPACQAVLERLTDPAAALEIELHVARASAHLPAYRPAPPPPGAAARPELPGYEIEAEIGRGGMGVVYRARHISLNRTVAIKTILAGALPPAEAGARFVAEARAVARASHPNIVQVFDLGVSADLAYYVMEFVGGGSLADRLAEPWPPADAARLIEAVARGVHQAHRAGIVHRDLKPANILLAADGTPKVGDFGVAKFLQAGPGLTRSQEVIGSPSYMAPEQARGGSAAVGPAADVYALGAVLYEMLAGRRPFVGATPLEVLDQVRTEPPPRPTTIAPAVPKGLEVICLKCLEKDPARRYESAEALADDLRRFLTGGSRVPWRLVAGAVGVGLAIGLVVWRLVK